MFGLYKKITSLSAPILSLLLKQRLRTGKENSKRYIEKKGIASIERPSGNLIWIHAASVGEAQSALILVNNIIQKYKTISILITTGTVTSSNVISDKLPKRAFHQFYPLDHPDWVKKFLTHWTPDGVIWIESELWPNMLSQIKKRKIPSILVNARMSEKSYKSWKHVRGMIESMLETFDIILCQDKRDEQRYTALGSKKTVVTDNLKYSASPLPYDKQNYNVILQSIGNRTVWLYASTHKGEEHLACEMHKRLKTHFPDLLTIIVPRHPERRNEIKEQLDKTSLYIKFRGGKRTVPEKNDDIYVVDTLGELGLFYQLVSIAMIGRSFSDDGGGGHNPIEAALLNCAVIYGPNIQNLQSIYEDMNAKDAALCVTTHDKLYQTLKSLLSNPDEMNKQKNNALRFAMSKNNVINTVMPYIDELLIPNTK